MTAYDVYANADLSNGKIPDSVNVAGNKTITMIETCDIKTTYGAGSVIRLFKVGANLIPVDIKVVNTAATAGVADLGIYEDGGGVLDADALAASMALGTAAAISAPKCGLAALTNTTLGKKIYELAGHTMKNKATGYELALTITTAATAAGKATVIATFVQG